MDIQYCPNTVEVRELSNFLWSKYQVVNSKRLVRVMKDFFARFFPNCANAVAIESLCRPLVLFNSKGVSLASCIQNKNYVISEDLSGIIEISEGTGGYFQEELVVEFLKQTYGDSTQYLGSDVEMAHKSLIAHGVFNTNLIVFLHDYTVKYSRLPHILCGLIISPIPDVFSRAIMRILESVCTNPEQTSQVVSNLCGPLYLDTNKQLSNLNRCRQMCGLVWHSKYQDTVTAKFGTKSWDFQWRGTITLYNGEKYTERWDERLMWVSVMYCMMLKRDVSVEDVPKAILLAFS